jgi:hypothetical protein
VDSTRPPLEFNSFEKTKGLEIIECHNCVTDTAEDFESPRLADQDAVTAQQARRHWK